jgi:hypothetical protein
MEGSMEKRLLLLSAATALALGGYLLGRSGTQVVHAQSDATIPQSYGHCVGVYLAKSYVELVFEDSDGTVRIVEGFHGKPIATYLRH